MKKILSLLICIVFFSACHQTDDGKKLSQKEMSRIFKDRYGSNPMYSYHGSRQKLLFLQKETMAERYHAFRAIVLERKGEQWTETANSEIEEGYSLDSLSIVTIGHKEFLYAEADQGGGSMGDHSITFMLYDVGADKTYSIEYEDFPEGGIVKTKLTKSKNLFSHLRIQRYLQHRIKNSDRIFQPDPRERLIRAFKSANKLQIQQLEDPESSEMLIRFKAVSTKEVLFIIPPDNDPESEGPSIVSTTENRDYVVVSYFKGPVLAFKKHSREYFCVYVPPLMDEYVPHLEFNQSGNLVLAGEEGGKPFCVVDLDEHIYKKR